MQRYNLRKKSKKWFVFLLGGLLNTSISYLFYFLFLIILPYQVSYFLAFSIGIIFSYYYNSIIVFQADLSLKKFLSYPIIYVFQYIASAFALAIMVDVMKINEMYAPLFVSAILVPLSYTMSKIILSRAPNS
ncbi:GtrA family protein [Legionella fallonii]|uniref:GtrA/DPMS transmembrane domain-containing protein n=1 Tax=Legionella fallonii LLAP-10 TaxID=1212491 RepID=A0A098GAI4_9GAMM|nr:membrane protein of unknown function [GtrA-like protein] [Legionella fallonii LLAP-10]